MNINFKTHNYEKDFTFAYIPSNIHLLFIFEYFSTPRYTLSQISLYLCMWNSYESLKISGKSLTVTTE